MDVVLHGMPINYLHYACSLRQTGGRCSLVTAYEIVTNSTLHCLEKRTAITFVATILWS